MASTQWSFRCYVDPAGVDQIHLWYNSQSASTRSKFFQRLSGLRTMPFDEWVLPMFRNLRHEGTGLGELRFKTDGVQQRPLGFRSGPTEYTWLLCAIEQSDRFIPKAACVIALDRKREVEKDRSRTNAIWLAFQ